MEHSSDLNGIMTKQEAVRKANALISERLGDGSTVQDRLNQLKTKFSGTMAMLEAKEIDDFAMGAILRQVVLFCFDFFFFLWQ